MASSPEFIAIPAFNVTVKRPGQGAEVKPDDIILGEFALSHSFPRNLVALGVDKCQLGGGQLWMARVVQADRPLEQAKRLGESSYVRTLGAGQVVFVAGNDSILVFESVQQHGATVYVVAHTDRSSLLRLVCRQAEITAARFLELMALQWGTEQETGLPIKIQEQRPISGLDLYTKALKESLMEEPSPEDLNKQGDDEALAELVRLTKAARVVAMARAVGVLHTACGRPVLAPPPSAGIPVEIPESWRGALDEKELEFWSEEDAKQTALPYILQEHTRQPQPRST